MGTYDCTTENSAVSRRKLGVTDSKRSDHVIPHLNTGTTLPRPEQALGWYVVYCWNDAHGRSQFIRSCITAYKKKTKLFEQRGKLFACFPFLSIDEVPSCLSVVVPGTNTYQFNQQKPQCFICLTQDQYISQALDTLTFFPIL